MKTTHTIGIDLGGTKIEAILHDGKRVLKTVRVPTEAEKGYAHVLEVLADAVQKIRTNETVAIGLATPGFIQGGKLTCSPNTPLLENKPIASDLAKRATLPVVHENDAKCFALAEARLGAGRGKTRVIGLIVGTGVGAGVVTEHGILRGTNGGAGEVGHAPYREKDFEYYTQGSAWVRLYKDIDGKIANPSAGDVIRAPARDKEAAIARDACYDALAALCGTIINAYNPEVIVFGGGVSKSLDMKRVQRESRAYCVAALWKSCSCRRFAISDSAGAIGAAVLARESVTK